MLGLGIYVIDYSTDVTFYNYILIFERFLNNTLYKNIHYIKIFKEFTQQTVELNLHSYSIWK